MKRSLRKTPTPNTGLVLGKRGGRKKAALKKATQVAKPLKKKGVKVSNDKGYAKKAKRRALRSSAASDALVLVSKKAAGDAMETS